jgi:hypothetical protein
MKDGLQDTLGFQAASTSSDTMVMDIESVPSEVLKRLIEEVRYEASNNITAYNRTHNRHNRGR